VALGAVLARLDRWAGRFNRWFGSTAVAAGSQHPGGFGPPVVDPTAVVAALGELDAEAEAERREQPD
jgi:hypothetical protein